MGVRHILSTRAEALDSENLRTYFTFAVSTATQQPNDFRALVNDPIPLLLCQHISDRLKVERFNVSEVSRGKPWGAGIHVRFPAFEIRCMVMAEPLPDKSVTYFAFSSCSRFFWKHPAPEEVAGYWQKISDVIESVLREDPQVTSLRRMTRSEERQEEREHRVVTKHA